MFPHELQHKQQHHAGQSQDGVAHPAEGVWVWGGPRGKGVGGGEERGVAGEGVEGKEAGSKHGFSLWLLFPFTEPGFLYTVLELVIFLPQHLE